MGSPLNFDLEPDEIELFFQEVDEHIQTLETDLLSLEQATNQTAFDAVFRAAHTLKAVAATIGHHRMADLTHALETLFEQLRGTGNSLSSATIDELLAIVDVLKTLRDEVVNLEASDVDVQVLVVQLSILGENVTNVAHIQTRSAVSTPAHQLTQEQITQVKTRQQAGHPLLEIRVSTAADAFAQVARLVQAAKILAGVGEIIVQNPSETNLLANQHDGTLRVILATEVNPETISQRLSDIPDIEHVLVEAYVVNEVVQLDELLPEKSPTITNQHEHSTVRISVERLDILMNLVGELVTDRTRLHRIEDVLRSKHGKDSIVSALGETTAHFDRVVDQLQHEVMQARMLPIANLFTKFPRLTRDLARRAGKQIDLVTEGEATELDRSMIEVIGDPLIHLLRNAIDHGIESSQEREAAGKPPTGMVRIAATHEEGHIVITVQDDGRGLDPNRIRQVSIDRGLISNEEAAQLDNDSIISLIFRPSLSTAEQVTEISGRGVGLDVVLTNIRRLSGSVVVESEIGQGTTFRITLPLTLAILDTMLVGVGNDVYAIPLMGIVETLHTSEVVHSNIKGSPVIHWRDQVLPLIYLREFFAHPHQNSASVNGSRQAIVIVSWGKLRVGLVVDQLIGKQEAVIKSLSPILGNIVGISGCTILGDGRVVLIVDIPSIINAAIQLQKERITL